MMATTCVAAGWAPTAAVGGFWSAKKIAAPATPTSAPPPMYQGRRFAVCASVMPGGASDRETCEAAMVPFECEPDMCEIDLGVTSRLVAVAPEAVMSMSGTPRPSAFSRCLRTCSSIWLLILIRSSRNVAPTTAPTSFGPTR